MSEHTPGPWECNASAFMSDGDDKRCYFVVRAAHGMSGKDVPNARLIALAPELLEDLDTMIAWHDEVIKALGPIPLPSPFGIDKFRSDVAKAKGETE